MGPFEFADKLPLKRDYAGSGVRVVPGASARWGSFLGNGVICMPSYVNIGARVGAGTMVDTWATVGSCAQIGEQVHLSGGVGIGGVLEPAQAAPVVIEDEVMIGSRCMITQGARVGPGLGPRRGHHPEPLDPGHRRRDRRGAEPGPRPALVRGRPGLPAPGVPRGRVLPPLRPGHQAAHRGGASRQGPARPTSCASTASRRDRRHARRAVRAGHRPGGHPVGQPSRGASWPTRSRRRCASARGWPWNGWGTTWWPAPTSGRDTRVLLGRSPRHRPAGRRQRGAAHRGRRAVRGGCRRHEGRAGRLPPPGRVACPSRRWT